MQTESFDPVALRRVMLRRGWSPSITTPGTPKTGTVVFDKGSLRSMIGSVRYPSLDRARAANLEPKIGAANMRFGTTVVQVLVMDGPGASREESHKLRDALVPELRMQAP